MLLQPHARGGKVGTREVKAIYNRFLQFHWHELIHLRGGSNRSRSTSGPDQRKKAAMRLIQCGEMSRASQILTSQGLAPTTDDTVSKLSSKHPKRRTSQLSHDDFHEQEKSEHPFSLKKEAYFEAIRKAPRGSGAGPSGWRYEHLRGLLENDLTCNLFYGVCSLIADGKVPDSVLPLLTASRLIALPKANSDVRPIAIGEAIRRITAKALCIQLNESFCSYFSPIQHGIATRGGAELLIHHISFLMESNPDCSVLSTDVKNAFNSVSRDSILKESKKNFPEIYAHVRQMYDRPSTLIYVNGQGTVKLQSEEGVHQGDPLGPVLFSAALHPIVTVIQNNHPGITLLAYLDDVYVLGPPKDALAVLLDLKASLSEIGLEIKDEKCKLYFPTAPDNFSAGVPVSKDGIDVLGSPVGNHDYVQSRCLAVANMGSSLCSKLLELDDPQCGLLLLRHCHVPRLNFLARTVPPDRLLHAAVCHDHLTRATFTDMVGLNELDDTGWSQATLKVGFGGFGLSSTQKMAHLAFLASWAHSLKELPLRFPPLKDRLERFIEGSNTGQLIRTLVAKLPPKSGADDDEQFHTLEQMTEYPRKLQHRLTVDASHKRSEEVIKSMNSERHVARIRSLHGKGAGAWLEVIPTSDKNALKPNEFRVASCMRLGAGLPFSRLLKTCDCGTELDREGYHLLTCKYGGGPVWTHNSIVSAWSDCLSDLLIPHQIEPRQRFVDNENRPDITLYDTDTGITKECDVSIAHPWSKDIIKGAAREGGHAAAKREAAKSKKYSEESLADGSKPIVVPLVFEHFGRWGLKADELMNELGKKARGFDGRRIAVEFKTFWRKRLSITLQKCNSRVILRKLSRLSVRSLGDDSVLGVDRDIQCFTH